MLKKSETNIKFSFLFYFAVPPLWVKYLRIHDDVNTMTRVFKVKAKISQEVPEFGKGVRYVSLLVLADDESDVKVFAEKYFQEEGLKKENVEILDIEEIKFKKGGVLGVIIG